MSETVEFIGKIVDVKRDVEIPYASGQGTYQGTLVNYTVGGKSRSKSFATKMLSAVPELSADLDALVDGQLVKFSGYKNNQGFFNVTSIGKPDAVGGGKSESVRTTSGGSTDFNTRAARGQALNLAVTVAVADGKHNDDEFILSQVERFLELGKKVQEGEGATKKVVNEKKGDGPKELATDVI